MTCLICFYSLNILTHHVQELNVQELSLVTQDSQYGVRLQGEPDYERLGKRLEGDFKQVCDWLNRLPIFCFCTPLCPSMYFFVLESISRGML